MLIIRIVYASQNHIVFLPFRDSSLRMLWLIRLVCEALHSYTSGQIIWNNKKPLLWISLNWWIWAKTQLNSDFTPISLVEQLLVDLQMKLAWDQMSISISQEMNTIPCRVYLFAVQTWTNILRRKVSTRCIIHCCLLKFRIGTFNYTVCKPLLRLAWTYLIDMLLDPREKKQGECEMAKSGFFIDLVEESPTWINVVKMASIYLKYGLQRESSTRRKKGRLKNEVGKM